MKLPRRNFLHLAVGAAALPAVSRVARAQAYPARPVRWIVPFAPAGATDIIARLIGQWLSDRLGQPFVIENRPGGGGNIGTEAVVRASPDGYTLLLVGAFNAINATLYDKLNFNFSRDIAPVASVVRAANVMVVNPSVPATTVPEFIAYAKANPGKITMASSGTGTPSHLTGELFKMMARVDRRSRSFPRPFPWCQLQSSLRHLKYKRCRAAGYGHGDSCLSLPKHRGSGPRMVRGRWVRGQRDLSVGRLLSLQAGPHGQSEDRQGIGRG
jgi:hypothetical protein